MRGLISINDGDVPPGAEPAVYTAADGIELRVARWPATVTNARGTVLVCHGYTEFIEKYYEVISDLRERGYAVATFDWRGQGLSSRMITSRERGYATSFSDFVDDAVQVHDRFVVDTMPAPHYILAHSMGGNIAVRILQDQPERFARAVLSAPMLGWDYLPTRFLRTVSAAHVAMGFGKFYIWGAGRPNTKEPLFRVSSDRVRTERWLEFCRHESDLIVAGPTWRWLREAATSTQLATAPARVARIEAPVLLASAGKDYVVSSRSHQLLAAANPAIQLVEFPGAMHEILQERDEIRERFWSSFDEFMTIA